VKGSLILNYVAEKEKIDVTDEEIESEIDRIAADMNSPRQRVREILTKDGMGRLRNQVQNKKTLDFLRQHASIQTPVPNQ
jgi:trigger factor